MKPKEKATCLFDPNLGEIKLKQEQDNLNSAALCTVVIDDYNYMNEWVDYHLAIGFTNIFIYDNSGEHERTKNWERKRKDPRLHITAFPGNCAEIPAFKQCAHLGQQVN